MIEVGGAPASDHPADVYVTNFNRNFTGVSATAAGVARFQAGAMVVRLVGHALPGLHQPITLLRAFALSRRRPADRPFSIWHVRRNSEMLAAIFGRDVLRLPIRIVFTSAAQRRHSAFPRWLISRVDAVIATTEQAASFVPGVRAVIPHGVDLERFHPAADREAAWRATGFPGWRGVATIGRIRPEKGVDRFVDVMCEALPALPDVTALVIGRATAEHAGFLAELKRRIATAGLADRILFTGEMAGERLAEIMRALDLLVALPRYEGYGMTPLEAMASGVPVIAADTGHFRAFIGGGQAGLLVDGDDANGVAQAMCDLIGNRERHRDLARSARLRAEENFGVADEARAVVDVYRALWQDPGLRAVTDDRPH